MLLNISCTIVKQFGFGISRLFGVSNQNFFRTINLGMIKRTKMTKKIGTHDGNFHCDEILACFMLKQLEEFKDAEIIRTRNLDVLKTCDILVDVGREFIPSENKFDHHQSSFIETLSSLRPELGPDYNIRLSSAGLIYTYFGEKVIASILKNKKDITLPKESLLLVYKKVYENFIREIDAIDNGVQICDGEPRYQITSHLSARIGHLYPSWNCKENIDIMSQFNKGQQMAGDEFVDRIISYTTIWLPAREIVRNSMNNAEKIHESGEIIELSVPCPWKQHLFDLEKELNLVKKFKYVLFINDDNDWRVMAVPHEPSSFMCRKFLHKDWRGLSAEKIAKLSGVDDAVFCHATGFVGGAKSRDGVLKMAILSLEGEYED